jgi:hypothetical protein
MNLVEDSWLEYVQSWCELALTNLDHAGFSENDIEALTCAPRSELTNDSWHRENLSRTPSASDIAIVKVIQVGMLIHKLSPKGDEDRNIKLAYLFGQNVAYAGAYLSLPRAEALSADKPSQLHELLQYTSDTANKELYRAMRQKEGMALQKAKTRKKLDERNALLCQTAQRLRAEENVADRNLAVETWKTWCSQDKWGRLRHKEIGVKTIRQILRDGCVLPPAKSNSGK